MLKLRNHNIILPKYFEIVKKKGSSLIFSASGGWDKEKEEKPAEKIAVGSEGEAEEGDGGNSASPEPKRSPAALPEALRAEPSKNIFFSLIEKKFWGSHEIKNCKENIFAWHASFASGGGAERQFRSKKVRIWSNKRTTIKLSGILPTDSAARSAERYGNTGSPATARLAKRRFEPKISLWQ